MRKFPISRDPPEGGTVSIGKLVKPFGAFPISRDPPEGGTTQNRTHFQSGTRVPLFPISRDPPEGGTSAGKWYPNPPWVDVSNF